MCGATEGGLSLDGVNVAKEAVVQGRVVRGGEPVGNAYVRLLDRTGEFTAEVPTSATGHFRFFAGDGEWTLRTLAPKADPVDRVGLGCQGAQGPLAVAGEEAEVAGGRGGDLGGELTGAVEQTHVGVADRLATANDAALDHGLLGDVHAVEGQAALSRAAHQASPFSSPRETGTPTSEPYSVHEPS